MVGNIRYTLNYDKYKLYLHACGLYILMNKNHTGCIKIVFYTYIVFCFNTDETKNRFPSS